MSDFGELTAMRLALIGLALLCGAACASVALAQGPIEKSAPQGKDPPGNDEVPVTPAPHEHKGVITPPPVGDKDIYTNVPDPNAGSEKEIIPPPGTPGGVPNVEPR
jgi:hypothetical protein